MSDIDIQIAQALGWKDIVVSDETGRQRLPLDTWRQQHPDDMPIYLTGRSPDMPDWPSSVIPHYEDDTDWLEDEVERRGLQLEYVGALGDVLWGGWGVSQPIEWDWIWDILRATPEQRAQAFLKALTP